MVKRRRAAAPKTGPIDNPFDRREEPTRFKVTALLLRKGEHSWEDLKAAAGGTLSTRTMGAILVALEKAGARFSKRVDAEQGTVYKRDADAPSIAKLDGPDATGEHPPQRPAKKAGKKGSKKAAAKKKATKKSSKKIAKKKAARKAPAKRPAKRAARATSSKPTKKRAAKKRATVKLRRR